MSCPFRCGLEPGGNPGLEFCTPIRVYAHHRPVAPETERPGWAPALARREPGAHRTTVRVGGVLGAPVEANGLGQLGSFRGRAKSGHFAHGLHRCVVPLLFRPPPDGWAAFVYSHPTSARRGCKRLPPPCGGARGRYTASRPGLMMPLGAWRRSGRLRPRTDGVLSGCRANQPATESDSWRT